MLLVQNSNVSTSAAISIVVYLHLSEAHHQPKWVNNCAVSDSRWGMLEDQNRRFSSPIICLQVEWPALQPLCRHWSYSPPLGTKESTQNSVSRRMKRVCCVTHPEPLISHLGYSLHCPHLDNNHPEDWKDTQTLRYERYGMIKCRNKKGAHLLCGSIILDMSCRAIVSLSGLHPFQDPCEKCLGRASKSVEACTMKTTETVFPHLMTVSGAVCFVPPQ